MKTTLCWLFAYIVMACCAAESSAKTLLVEAETFADHGGWKTDTQFIEIMGSPYLMAHGLGRPVSDATTTVRFPAVGTYKVFVRTKDWVARWDALGSPGKFQLIVDGRPLSETFGTQGAEWCWHDGGSVEITKTEVKLALHDLTGFNGRCDAILFTTDESYVPPNSSEPMASWRKELLGLPASPEKTDEYDLVVVGGGFSGMCAAISAARLGCRVALVQNRPVLGGNSSSEVRVWPQGLTRRGRYPHLGEIVEELATQPRMSPGEKEEAGDEKKETVVRAEKNLTLLLNHHAYAIEREGDKIAAVVALGTKTSELKRLASKLFVDCTGHGTLGFLAGAKFETTEKGHMGLSNMWRWEQTDREQPFPAAPWALDLEMGDFPYPSRGHAPWFWETGFDKDPIEDLEYMRDWNLRAVFGAFGAMKNRGGANEHKNARMTWMAYIGGPRESRRLMGDVVLTKEDVVTKRDFPDGCVPTTWSIDLHYPQEKYIPKKHPEDPFISKAVFDRRVDKNFGYPVPYRCFYSENVPNLFMAGRCISVTHEALGTVRVMQTCGMMGEVVGKAASICVLRDCEPRDVYQSHLPELIALMNLPGRARRATVDDPIEIVGDPPPLPSPRPTGTGIHPRLLSGLVIDTSLAELTGDWMKSTHETGFIGKGYLHDNNEAKGEKSVRFEFTVKTSGQYDVRMAYRHSASRATRVPVTVHFAGGEKQIFVNQQEKPPLEHGFFSLGTFALEAGKTAAVVISNKETTGHVIVDAIQVLPVE